MCGICGFASVRHPGLIKRMADLIAHRGPDDEGFYEDEFVSLGHRRLSIIDLSGGHQPMTDEDGSVWIVFNGEIYNFKRLRRELEKAGHRFRTNSDTEVILHGYEEWGERCPERLNGMFAFALWDTKRRRLLLARDHIGIKPLYYTLLNGAIYFASEIKSLLLAPGMRRAPNVRALCRYLLFTWPLGVDTMLEGVQRIEPGGCLVWEEGRLRTWRFWRLEIRERERPTREVHEALRGQLDASVRAQLASDVPLGMTLSGGLDSSSVVASYRAVSDAPMETFCVGYGLSDDELPAAQIVADHLRTDHYIGTISFNDISRILPTVIWHVEEPIANYVAATTYFLAKKVREYVKTCLIGEGGDELFGGYTRYKIFSHRLRWLPLLPRVRFYLNPGHFSFPLSRIPEVSPAISAALVRDVLETEFYPYFNGTRSPLSAALHFDIEHELPNNQLLHIDKLTMAHSLEARVPFLDYEFVELAMSIPASQKMPAFREKAIMREAMAGRLPKEIVNRPKGASQYILRPWLHSGLTPVIEDLLSDAKAVESGLISATTVRELLPNALKRQNRVRRMCAEVQLFSLLSLELWCRIFLYGKKPEDIECR